MEQNNNNNETKAITMKDSQDLTKYNIPQPDATLYIPVLFAMFAGVVNYMYQQNKAGQKITFFGLFLTVSIAFVTSMLTGNILLYMGMQNFNLMFGMVGCAGLAGPALMVMLGSVFNDVFTVKFKDMLNTLFGINKDKN